MPVLSGQLYAGNTVFENILNGTPSIFGYRIVTYMLIFKCLLGAPILNLGNRNQD